MTTSNAKKPDTSETEEPVSNRISSRIIETAARAKSVGPKPKKTVDDRPNSIGQPDCSD